MEHKKLKFKICKQQAVENYLNGLLFYKKCLYINGKDGKVICGDEYATVVKDLMIIDNKCFFKSKSCVKSSFLSMILRFV